MSKSLFSNLFQADQALESEREAVVRRLYKFRNVNASSMRTIIIADNINFSDQEVQPTVASSKSDEQTQSSSSLSESEDAVVNVEEQPSASCRAEPMEESQSPMEAEAPPCECECDKHYDDDVVDGHLKSRDAEPSAGALSVQSQPVISIVSRTGQKQKVKVTQRVKSLLSPLKGRNKLSESPDSMLESCTSGEPDTAVAVATKCPKCGKDFVTVGDAATVENVGGRLRSSHSTEHISDKGMDLDSSASSSAGSKPPKRTHDRDEDIDALAREKDKYLIFTMGTKTYTPHQIGIKRIDAQQVANVMKADMTYHPPVLPPVPQPDVLDGDQDPDEEFDTADHVVELNGHIIGMCLSPDQR